MLSIFFFENRKIKKKMTERKKGEEKEEKSCFGLMEEKK